jgi:two-component system, NarL family, nitrate/nitrite response regulator NarL
VTRVLLCDDHAVFADALAVALAAGGDEVVAVARTVTEGLARARATRPDVVLMDLHFASGPDGLDGVRALTAESPAPRVILLSANVDGGVLKEAIAAGADGVLSKAQPLSAVIRAVQQVAAGAFYADTQLLRRSMRPAPAELDEVQLAAQFFTPREREVLERLVQGTSTSDMAEAMGVGVSTVRTHVQAVLSKLGVSSRLEAVLLAVSHRLVEPPQRHLPGTARTGATERSRNSPFPG